MEQYALPVLLGLVEGITEFLPISSTGHLIIVNEFTGFTGPFAAMFDVVIQFGAILAVAVHYRTKLFSFIFSRDAGERRSSFMLWVKAAAGIIPAVILGFLFGKYIKEVLFNPSVVAAALIIGGIIILFVERMKHEESVTNIDDLSFKKAIAVGCFQCIAMVPGVSRSAATIIGGMLLGSSRMVAAEFSFFLAIPTMFAASCYELLKHGAAISGVQAVQLALGFIVSFITAYLVIAAFIKFISRHDFIPFGYYRIALGAFVLIYFLIIR